MVTAADRAAATCQRLVRYKLISCDPKGWRGRSESCQTGSVHRLASAEAKSRVRRRFPQKAPSAEGAVSRRLTEDKPSSWYSYHLHCKRTLPCLLPQKEGDHPQQRMVEDILLLPLFSRKKRRKPHFPHPRGFLRFWHFFTFPVGWCNGGTGSLQCRSPSCNRGTSSWWVRREPRASCQWSAAC